MRKIVTMLVQGYNRRPDGVISIFFKYDEKLKVELIYSKKNILGDYGSIIYYKDSITLRKFDGDEDDISNVVIKQSGHELTFSSFIGKSKFDCEYFNYDLDNEIFNINEKYFVELFIFKHIEKMRAVLEEYMYIQSIFPGIGAEYMSIKNEFEMMC